MTTPLDTDTPDVDHLALRVDELAAGLTQLTSDVEDLSAVLLGRSGPFAQCTPERHA